MEYREAALANVDDPIVVILPNRSDVYPTDQDVLLSRARPSAIKHASYLFGRDFESVDHLTEFCNDLPTAERVLGELKGGDRLIFDTEYGSTAQEQLTEIIRVDTPGVPGADPRHAGAHIAGLCIGRMTQALGLQLSAAERYGAPLIMADISWQYYKWLLEYQCLTSDQIPELASLHVSRALMTERTTNLDWLGNVPMSTVIEIRKNGLADEVRSIVGSGVENLIARRPENFFRTADQVVENSDRAFREHSQKLRDAKASKLKLYGLALPGALVSGVIGIAGAITGSVPLAVGGALLGTLGLPNLKDIKGRRQDLVAREREYQTSATGLLFRHTTTR